MLKSLLSTMLLFAVTVTVIAIPSRPVSAQESNLPDRQSAIVQRYERLEELLLRLAEMEAAENPERAALLKRAARQSRDQFVLDKLKSASGALREKRFQEAVDNQANATQGLEGLLQLLMSEDRSKRIRDEKERIANLIKDLKRVERAERSTRARTENGADMEEVQKEQEAITDRSESLRDELAEKDPSDPSDKEQDPSDQESQPNDQKPNDQKPSDQKPSDQKPSDQKPSDQEPSEQEAEQQPPPPPQSPQQLAEQQLQKAIEKMQQAEQELKEGEREKTVEKQREAEEDLRQAIDRLERILRQLREEEMLRELAKIEARLRKMAAMQSKVLDDTITLAATPKSQRNRQTDLKAGNLAFEEKKITLEADRAMLLLREEGSSVAFPEVVSQIRLDTTHVAERLGQTKIDAVTQGIQQDILSALEEMIEALQKAQRDLEKKQQEQQQQGEGQPGGQQEPPLVEALAELKLLRTMETRVKSTTTRYSELIESGESSTEEVIPLLQDLSERQNRLYQITRDLVLKRNQ
ncbi:hypothetical protein Q31b_22310 [Novipirellula aureliae]|uniref:Uncharacterized protein n=1 Tax=Novipirellula aureliae TaxID=2527966 RepID=A0A5C6E0I2_9BACT|nr:hypothetical protein [Novipirellula aureliae]TWU43193.1 hypothetical protein Q31b_22310 [Novipirellula aureliae]